MLNFTLTPNIRAWWQTAWHYSGVSYSTGRRRRSVSKVGQDWITSSRPTAPISLLNVLHWPKCFDYPVVVEPCWTWRLSSFSLNQENRTNWSLSCSHSGRN